MVELLAREILAGSDAVLDTVPRLTPSHERPEHMRPIGDFFAGVARGESMRLVLSSAPRFAKTTTIEHATAWLMFVRPGVKVVVVCCTASLAEQISRRIRSLVERLGLKIPRDQRAIDAWSTSTGSSLRAIGAGGALVGVGADVLLCDDLIPSMEAAHSPSQREQVEEWFETTALGRLEPGGSAIVCAHRWATDDISGRLVERGWPWANVPAICPATGQSNWPSRWSTRDLREKEVEVGPLAWSSLYMGHPRPKGGAVFADTPAVYDLDDLRAMFEARTCRPFIACDPAATAATHADHSVIMVVAFHSRPVMMDVVSIWRGQVEIPTLVEKLRAEQLRWRCPVAVEAVGAFKAVPQMLRRINNGLRIFELKATASKYTRSLPASAAWARGHIRFPMQGAPWLDQALSEIAAFTGLGDKTDDVPDCLSHAWTMSGSPDMDARRRRQMNQLRKLLPFG